MEFKEWLRLHESTPVTRGKELVYPPEVDAFSHSTNPRALEDFKSKLRTVKQAGRTLWNIDPESVYRIPYYTLQSRSLPDDKGWFHKEDKKQEQGAVEVLKVNSLSKTSVKSRTIPSAEPVGGWWHHRDDGTTSSVEIVHEK